LAHDPFYPRRDEMAGTYFALAERRLASGDRDGAAPLLRQAAALAPALGARVEARLLYLDGERARAKGALDPTPYRRALAADPGRWRRPRRRCRRRHGLRLRRRSGALLAHLVAAQEQQPDAGHEHQAGDDHRHPAAVAARAAGEAPPSLVGRLLGHRRLAEA